MNLELTREEHAAVLSAVTTTLIALRKDGQTDSELYEVLFSAGEKLCGSFCQLPSESELN